MNVHHKYIMTLKDLMKCLNEHSFLFHFDVFSQQTVRQNKTKLVVTFSLRHSYEPCAIVRGCLYHGRGDIIILESILLDKNVDIP